MRVSRERGFILIAMASSTFLLLAVIGLAFDLGRVYITRNEAQVFSDAAAMAAAQQLDGTVAGIARARAAVQRLPNRWNLGSQDFSHVVTEFSSDGIHWVLPSQENTAQDLRYARVTAPDNHVVIMFLSAVGGPANFNVPASAVAASHPVRLVE